MTKAEIIQQLLLQYGTVAERVGSLDDAAFGRAPEPGKWTPGQHLDHLCRSVRPLSLGLLLPAWAIRAVFGRANRPSRSYDELVSKYQAKLAAGGRASGPYIPPAEVALARRAKLITQLSKQVALLVSRLNRFSEPQLDQLIIPHPLLGKLTLREMMYFTIYHAQHHLVF